MLHAEQKTNGGVPPQHRPLEDRVADKLRGTVRNVPGQTADMQLSREETAGNAKPAASPAKAACGVSRVFVLDRDHKPLMPCQPVRARRLLKAGRARVVRMSPFVIRLVDRTAEESEVQPEVVKFDPGANKTGLAICRVEEKTHHVLFLAEIEHRGRAIKKRMGQRSAYRRRRRSKNLRYRAPRFDNRTRSEGWLPPSLLSRSDNVISLARRFMRLIPISSIAVERVRFDMQKLENPDVEGIEYQQGTLFGYEVREYVLERYGRTCAYCGGLSGDPILEMEHFVPRRPRRGPAGTNRISNLYPGCRTCNEAKNNLQPEEWLEILSKSRKEIDRVRHTAVTRLLAGKKPSLAPAAAVNATRNNIFFRLLDLGMEVEASTGGRTKWNRSRFGIPKTHCLDAACVGDVDMVVGWRQPVLQIKAQGRGSYQRTRVDGYGFPRGYLMSRKHVHGFQTGDLVRAVVPQGKKQGTHVGRVAVRSSGSFNIQGKTETVQGVGWRHCCVLQKSDGYAYCWDASIPPPPEGRGLLERER
jgi:hypothetical protein